MYDSMYQGYKFKVIKGYTFGKLNLFSDYAFEWYHIKQIQANQTQCI